MPPTTCHLPLATFRSLRSLHRHFAAVDAVGVGGAQHGTDAPAHLPACALGGWIAPDGPGGIWAWRAIALTTSLGRSPWTRAQLGLQAHHPFSWESVEKRCPPSRADGALGGASTGNGLPHFLHMGNRTAILLPRWPSFNSSLIRDVPGYQTLHHLPLWRQRSPVEARPHFFQQYRDPARLDLCPTLGRLSCPDRLFDIAFDAARTRQSSAGIEQGTAATPLHALAGARCALPDGREFPGWAAGQS